MNLLPIEIFIYILYVSMKIEIICIINTKKQTWVKYIWTNIFSALLFGIYVCICIYFFYIWIFSQKIIFHNIIRCILKYLIIEIFVWYAEHRFAKKYSQHSWNLFFTRLYPPRKRKVRHFKTSLPVLKMNIIVILIVPEKYVKNQTKQSIKK